MNTNQSDSDKKTVAHRKTVKIRKRGSKRKKRRNIKTTRKFKQYGKGKNDYKILSPLGEGMGRSSDSTLIFKKDRIIIPIQDLPNNTNLEIKKDSRLCNNWSANIRLPDGSPDGSFEFKGDDGNAIWIPLNNLTYYKDFDQLISFFNRFNSTFLTDHLINSLRIKSKEPGIIMSERTRLKSTCKTGNRYKLKNE